jgi:ABC-type enterochelin transport system permease subunit
MSHYSVGGWVERSAVLFFNSLFLFSLFRAWRLRHEPALKLRWMTRAIAILLGIATTRPIMGIFFATSSLTHFSPAQFFGIAFWIGFSINTLIVELWLRSRAGKFQIERMALHRSSLRDQA